jgi:hypothetical protein
MKNRTSPAPPRQTRGRSRALPRLGWSAAAGLAAAAALTVFVGTARHAALTGHGQKSPGFSLACDFAVMFVLITAAVFITASRRARRAGRRADGAPAARRGRRAAARGW